MSRNCVCVENKQWAAALVLMTVTVSLIAAAT